MKFRLFTACALISALLLSSCGGANTSGSPGTDEESPGAPESTSEQPSTSGLDTLPEKDYGGRTFTILQRNEFSREFDAAESSADIIEDAIYRRNLAVTEKYNIQLKTVGVDGSYWSKDIFLGALRKSVLAGDTEYDLVVSAGNYLCIAISDNLFTELNTLEELDTGSPWWSQGFVDNMEIGGRLYLITGDAALSTLENMDVTFFNKKLITQYGLENPYQIVRDGKWTFARLMEMAKSASADLNGDSLYTPEDDQFGYLTTINMINALVTAFGIHYTAMDSEGFPSLSFMSERTSDAFDAVKAALADKTAVHNYQGETLEIISGMSDMFAANKALFMSQTADCASVMRAMDADFGILPFPKLDEAQERYYTQVLENASVIGIPSVVADIEMSAVILEALGAASWDIVTPAYYDTALRSKFTRDEESAEMLDLIRESVVYDFIYLNSPKINDIIHLFRTAAEAGGSLVSQFESKQPVYQKSLDSFIESYRALG